MNDHSLHALATNQRGTAGDLTASRKVRVYDVPVSEANGRVVIESADFELAISAPEWRMSPEENQGRARLASQGMADFMGRAARAMQADADGAEEEQPMNEHDYEKFFKECDARTAKLEELMKKHGNSKEGWQKIAEAMGWDSEAFEDEPDEEQFLDRANDEEEEDDDEILDAPEPAPPADREGIDWIRTEYGFTHPLQHRCVEGALRFRKEIERLGLANREDENLWNFLAEFHGVAVKLAGALVPIVYAESLTEAAFTAAYLKRALDRLHNSLAELDTLASKNTLPGPLVVETRKELLEIREGVLRLMTGLRGR